MSAIHPSETQPIRTTPLLRTRAILDAAFEWLSAEIRRRRGLRQLARLDDRLLRDIGLTRYDLDRKRGTILGGRR